jgi:hypothetical protein
MLRTLLKSHFQVVWRTTDPGERKGDATPAAADDTAAIAAAGEAEE